MSLALLRGYGRLFAGTRRILALTVALAVLQSLVLLPVALLVKRIFDESLPSRRTGEVVVSGAVILALYLAGGGLALLTRRLVLRTSKAGLAQLRVALSEKLFALPLAYLDRTPRGELHSTLVMAPERVERFASLVVAEIVPSAIVGVTLAGVAVVLSPLLSLVLLGVVLLLALLSRALGPRVGASVKDWHDQAAAYSTEVQVGLSSAALIKVRAAEESVLALRRKRAAALAEAGQRALWGQSLWSVAQDTLAAATGAVVLVAGGVLVADGRMTVGELLGFYAVLALLLRQLSNVARALPRLVEGQESLRAIDALLAEPSAEPYTGGSVLSFTGAVELRAVTFGYREPLFEGLSLAVDAGERVAVVGPNGAGKSTLAALVLGLYRPTSGCVLADGVPYDELDLRALRGSMGVVLQDALMVRGSVFANVAFGRPSASRESVSAALALAGASFVTDLDAEVGDDGGQLSGGQLQRLALARALLDDPPLLVLDEPSNHLDDAGIRDLLDTLSALPSRPAVLCITHDEAVASWADRVVRLRDGHLDAHDPDAQLRS